MLYSESPRKSGQPVRRRTRCPVIRLSTFPRAIRTERQDHPADIDHGQRRPDTAPNAAPASSSPGRSPADCRGNRRARPGPGAEGGPFWELAPTASTPRVTGTGIELVDGRTLRLHDSEPAGWTIVFTAEGPLQAFGFHASDNRTHRIEAIARGPGGNCAAGPESKTRAQLQLAMLEPVPQGQATISGPCFGAQPPGITLQVVFIDAPAR